jgi:anti-sigma factor RsiW
MTHDDGRSRGAQHDRTPDAAGIDAALDADLSALLDGELPPEAAGALRARLADEPALAARLERLAEVDGHVRRLAGTAVDEVRLARLRAGLQARLDADPRPSGAARDDTRVAGPGTGVARRREGTRVVRPRFARSVGPLAAALAAGLALYWLAAPRPPAAPPQAEGITAGGAVAGEPAAPLASDAGEPTLEEVSDAEIAIAMQYDVLSDLEVIEHLELLELLEDLEAPERL